MKLTYELRGLGDDALASRLVPRHAFSPPDARQALAGQWLYMVGDSSLRGLWLSLYQQLAGDQMGDAMDVMHWLGPERDIMEMAWADAVVNATERSARAVVLTRPSETLPGYHTYHTPHRESISLKKIMRPRFTILNHKSHTP